MKLLKYALLIMLGVSIQDIAAMKALENKQQDVMMQRAVAMADSIINDIEKVTQKFENTQFGSIEAMIQSAESWLGGFTKGAKQEFLLAFPRAKNAIDRLNKAIENFETKIKDELIKAATSEISKIYRRNSEYLENVIYETEALGKLKQDRKNYIENILNLFDEAEQEAIKKNVEEEEKKFREIEMQAYDNSYFFKKYGDLASSVFDYFRDEKERIALTVDKNLPEDQRAAAMWNALIEIAKKEIDKTEQEIVDIQKEIEKREGLSGEKLDLNTQIADKKKYMEAIAHFILKVFRRPPLTTPTYNNAHIIIKIQDHLPKFMLED